VLTALAASSISGASFSSTGWASMRFGWAAFVVPFAFVFQPALVLMGTPVELTTVLVGVASGLWAARRLVVPQSRGDFVLAAGIVAGSVWLMLAAGATADFVSSGLLAVVIVLSIVQSMPEIEWIGARVMRRGERGSSAGVTPGSPPSPG
jgi:TRAP-type uncharacterized transport system fused permease subunit